MANFFFPFSSPPKKAKKGKKKKKESFKERMKESFSNTLGLIGFSIMTCYDQTDQMCSYRQPNRYKMKRTEFVETARTPSI